MNYRIFVRNHMLFSIFICSSATEAFLTAIKRERSRICSLKFTSLFALLRLAKKMSDCAVANDGTLKDANDIEWFNDADDLVPLPLSRPLTAGSSALAVASLDNFFASRPSAKKVGGERHSTRNRKPSKRTIDPDNAEVTGNTAEDVASGQKRKVGISGASRRVARKIIESESSSDEGDDSASDKEQPNGNDTDCNLHGDDDNGDDDDDDDDNLADAWYNRLKSLGDEDCEVLTLFR
jgi:hypothetical protein